MLNDLFPAALTAGPALDSPEMRVIRKDGYLAYIGLDRVTPPTLDENPHPLGSLAHSSWANGWWDAYMTKERAW